jgi:hypothetical protein
MEVGTHTHTHMHRNKSNTKFACVHNLLLCTILCGSSAIVTCKICHFAAMFYFVSDKFTIEKVTYL